MPSVNTCKSVLVTMGQLVSYGTSSKRVYIILYSGVHGGMVTQHCITPQAAGNHYTLPLQVPKHEIFDFDFFASKEPIWSPVT